ncbi:transposable element Tcb2 transposase [Trichonephila clavipes]|uniref:Transposable element Tcb2 transposase n=1 Tax=Trichonephila clavipes TaxID=2585209 RepID=A0A8X6UWK0_TRICX|nr:transposable element Tcb2 transposase [Trichonephila clavipes]
MARRNHLDYFKRGRMIGKLEEGAYRHLCSCRDRNQQKRVSFRALGKRSKPKVQMLERLVVAARGRQLQGMTNISSCRRKVVDGSQQASLLSISLQQRGDKLVQRAQKLDNCQWSRVLFTDESRFSTRSDSQRVLICREIGTRFYTSNNKKRHHYGGPGVLVWGDIMLNGRTELHIFDRGSVTGDLYCEEAFISHVHLFRGTIVPVEELLENEDITRKDWPAYSSDLNPIEHLWDAFGRRIAARLHHPENTQQLKQMLIEEWARLPQGMLHQLVLSMRRRCEAIIAVRGGHIPYYGTCACCSSCWIDHHKSRYYAFNKPCFCLIP